jgi:hypothetical protein
MFAGIAPERFARLTEVEKRLLDNVKKAFHESDRNYASGRPQDCMEPMCKAIDTAKTLRRSLRGEDTSGVDNRRRFKEFIDLEVPDPARGGFLVRLVDARTGQPRDYSFSELVHAIRCMVHENENLNAAEKPDYHILLEWGTTPQWVPPSAPATLPPVSGTVQDPCLNWAATAHSPVMGIIGGGGRITCNGHLIWGRLREVMGKFITGVDAMVGFARVPIRGSYRSARRSARCGLETGEEAATLPDQGRAFDVLRSESGEIWARRSQRKGACWAVVNTTGTAQFETFRDVSGER